MTVKREEIHVDEIIRCLVVHAPDVEFDDVIHYAIGHELSPMLPWIVRCIHVPVLADMGRIAIVRQWQAQVPRWIVVRTGREIQEIPER